MPERESIYRAFFGGLLSKESAGTDASWRAGDQETLNWTLMRKGLKQIAVELAEQHQEQERKLQEAKEASSPSASVANRARQELLAFLFGE